MKASNTQRESESFRMIQGGSEKNRMGSKRNTGKKRRTPEKAGEHRKNEELSKHRKKGENFGKAW